MSEFNYELIDQYLAGELSGEALAAFEKEMQASPALVNEVELYKNIQNEMKVQHQHIEEENKLRNTLTSLNKKYFEKKGAPVIKMNKRWLFAVAAVAAAVIVFIFWPSPGQSYNNEKLYAYYTKDVESLSTGERGANTDSFLIKAANSYNQKKYAEALPMLQQLSVKYPDDKSLQLAAGISLMQTGQADAAIVIFDSLVAGQTVYKDQGTWYKALALLKQNKLDECSGLLKSFPKEAGKYKEAMELIKKIEKSKK
jgi:predicted Zn-dependent protease